MGQCLFSFVLQEYLIVYRFFCSWFGYIYINHFVKIYKKSTLKKKTENEYHSVPRSYRANRNEKITFHRIAVSRHDKLQNCNSIEVHVTQKKMPDNPARGSSKIEMKRVASKNLIMSAD